MDTTIRRTNSSALLSFNLNTVLRNLFFPYYLMSVSIAIYFLNAGVSRVIVLLSLLASTITFNFTLEHLIPYIKKSPI